MKRFIVLLYILMVAVLGAATFVEHARGTDDANALIYHSVWFALLWALLALLLMAVAAKRRLWRRPAVCMLHLSFVVILSGAAVTALTSQKGVVHLLPGESVNAFTDAEQPTRQHAFPFRLRLDSFRVACYPGTQAPADFSSYLHITPADGKTARAMVVSMNRIGRVEGYRLYQSSYDEATGSSWLSVNYDPYGTVLTYVGYILLGLSMLGVLFSRREEFRRLLHHPLLRRSATLVLLLLFSVSAQAERHSLPALNRDRADSLAARQVVYNDRLCPFNTLARDFVLKLYGRTSYHGLTAEQVVSGWLLRPDAWQNEPMIRIKSGELRRLLGVEGRYARLSDLFDGTEYKLNRYWKGGDVAMAEGGLQKAIAETDEKVGLILMLRQGTLIVPRPAEVAPLSWAKVRAELLYNRLDMAHWLFMVSLALGFLSFAWMILSDGRNAKAHSLSNTHNRNAVSSHRKAVLGERMYRFVPRMFTVALWAVALLLAANYALRWYVAGRIPLSNGYETMLFMSLTSAVAACLLRRRFEVMTPFGFLLSGFTLLVAHLGQSNPQITPLVPVLVSPWLSTHVSFVMVAYSLLAFIFLDGVAGLCLPRRAERLMLLSRLLLYPAVFMLGAGIFLGAVWANQSWGSYWTWDPKEVWALVTFMIYGAAFHAASLPRLQRPRTFHVFAVAAFLTVLMTYFGVNFFLGGLHSYAG